jgi:hypothetical protein
MAIATVEPAHAGEFEWRIEPSGDMRELARCDVSVACFNEC